MQFSYEINENLFKLVYYYRALFYPRRKTIFKYLTKKIDPFFSERVQKRRAPEIIKIKSIFERKKIRKFCTLFKFPKKVLKNGFHTLLFVQIQKKTFLSILHFIFLDKTSNLFEKDIKVMILFFFYFWV